MKTIEVYLGHWGVIRCFNEQHRAYLIAAKALQEIYQSIQSWQGGWLYFTMEAEYQEAEATARAKCNALWDAIPDKTDDLTKRH